MGAVAAVATAAAGLVSLVLYLLRRHDSPEEIKRRRDRRIAEDFAAVDEALGESDADTVTRVFSELDDRADAIRLRRAVRAGSRRP